MKIIRETGGGQIIVEFNVQNIPTIYGSSVYVYDVSPFSFEYNITDKQGSFDIVLNTSELSNEAKQRMASHLQDLKDSNYISISDNLLEEIKNHILELHFYRADPISIGGYYDYPISITTDSKACGCGIGSPLGTPLDDVWNRHFNTTYNWNYGNTVFTEQIYSECPCFINLLNKAIEENLIKASDELKNWVEEELVPIPTDMSCNWDYYFNFSRQLSINSTNSVIVRWSCPAVNMGTEEFLQEHPDYKYSCALTKVVLQVSNTVKFDNTSWKTIYSGWYGAGEKELPFNMLQDNTAMTEIAINIGKILPFTDKGDVYLKAHLEFSDGSRSSDVIGQCPYKSMTDDASKLLVYTPIPRDGSTLTLHYGQPTTGLDEDVATWHDELKEPKISEDFEDNDSDVDFNMDVGTNSNIGLLTKTYAITENQLKQIGNKIWTGYFTELIDALNSSPIENIISVKAFPFEITGGTSKQIMLGNVEMGVNGNELPSNYSPIKVIKSDFEITPKFSGLLKWLNYSPFTNIQMFLPYVGIVDINPQLVMGKKCTLKYIYDVILGNCQACLYIKDVNNKSVEIGKWSGQLAIDIPITASNAVRMGVGHLTGTIDAISSFLHGNILGAIKDGIGVATQPFHSMTKGSPSSACDSFDMQNAYLIIDSPVYKYPSQFGHIYGYPCELYLYLNDLHGFVQCENVHIDGIPCMEEERVELLALLEEGVYL